MWLVPSLYRVSHCVCSAGRWLTTVAPRKPLPVNAVSDALDEEIYTSNGAHDKSVGDIAQEQTLPSQENQGMRPGEVSMGVGALPGKSTEAGVAVLPDERGTLILLLCDLELT